MKRRRPLLALFAVLTLALTVLLSGVSSAATSRAQPGASRPFSSLRLQLNGPPQIRFAGIYVAQELDLFDEQRLDVEVQPGGPGINPLQRLIDGQTDVAIGWISDALRLRLQGADIVNMAQLMQRPGTALVCRTDRGVKQPADLRGKRIGSWLKGDQFDLAAWLGSQGMGLSDVQLVPQRANARDLLDGRVDCATVMTYDEYLTILESGALRSDLYTVRFGEENSALLEDGLYVRSAELNNPQRRRQLVRLLRALAKGWQYTARYPEEAVAITARFMDRPDLNRQQQMLDEVLTLIDVEKGFGLLDPISVRRSVAIVGAGRGDPSGIAAAAKASWTNRIWREARIDGPQIGPLGPASRRTFATLVASPWFYALDLIGTAAFAISGYLRALQRRYDLWGCFILTLLPAVGGGTLRDLLVGGLRSPPFIFKDGTYLGIVVVVVGIGSLLAQLQSQASKDTPALRRLLTICDSVGLATFTIIGAKVAIESELRWWWIPICAALTCAGGGILLDVVTGREPRTFQGEPYEEIAIAGALVLIGGLLIADHFETLRWPVLAAMVVAWCFTFLCRELVILRNLQSWRPGRTEPSRR